MAFGSLEGEEDNAPLAEINMVPLIDVMLVLLVIFIVTAPMLTHAVKVDLPKASSSLNVSKPDSVQLAIDGESRLYWNGAAIEADALKLRLHDAAALQPQPELHIRADRSTPYEKVAQVMSLAASEGLGKIGFITDPSTPAP
ncbi:biopolymer transporter ExbD [Aquabacterium sp. NJ1]|uniref:ExbD/TolR family protein n=1 Tax=Aquabacterium sp. NJ1 TaxID=1538295 RepID=UPI00052C5E52|nr:biopolymer transporter ExbD [Aquabacterium sp. NJ1]KGM41403.1 biopolymer transporter ExbD [Aquabacterium sp. NJ1]